MEPKDVRSPKDHEDNDKLKNLMRTYLGDAVDSPELQYLFNERDKELQCIQYNISRNSSHLHLHKCVLLTHSYPIINDYLKEYLKLYNNINEVNEQGRTA